MGLNRLGDKLFSSPSLSRWVQYVDDLNGKNSGTKAIATLATQYGDDTLYKMIDAAKVIPETKDLAPKLQREQIQRWITTRKDSDDVFRLFDLEKAGGNLFNNPKFTVWAKYVDDLNAETPTTMIPTLKKHFYEEALFRMFGKAKTMEETKTIATKLETELVQSSINNLKTPEKFLKELGLNSDAFTVLENPLLVTWTKYLDGYNVKFPQEKTTMIETFTKTFGDGLTAKMIAAAKKQDVTKGIAAKLETAQLRLWLNTGQSIDDVYKTLVLFKHADDFRVFLLLGLDEAGDSILSNPVFNQWMGYVKNFNKEFPKRQESWFQPLLAWGGVEKMIEKGFQHPETVKLAQRVETAWLKNLLGWGKTPKTAFTSLKLKTVDNPLASPKFTVWTRYLTAFNKKYPDKKISMIDGLRNVYTDRVLVQVLSIAKNGRTEKLATDMQNALLNKWLAAKKTPEEIKLMLHGIANSDDMITRYATKLNKLE
ncbi:hypothetical protein DVH05_012422 [Phytophthora capsici]|nr:hypothetical protein DVH05_012422 [Phytophthora capsici]